jgi:hypothetical protein
MLIVGKINDFFKLEKLLVKYIIMLIILIYPVLSIINMDNLWIKYLGVTILMLISAPLLTLLPIKVSQIFPTNIRYIGAGICINFAIVIMTIIFTILNFNIYSPLMFIHILSIIVILSGLLVLANLRFTKQYNYLDDIYA